jgi:hypothetical protein
MNKLDRRSHLVGARQERRRHGEAKRFGSPEVDHETKTSRLPLANCFPILALCRLILEGGVFSLAVPLAGSLRRNDTAAIGG